MCTVFSDKTSTSLFVAKSHDNFVQNGMMFTNKRKMSKHSLAMPGENILHWQSTYGSLTFSQCGKGMPVSGMNEKGLVVEQATLPGTEYLPTDSRPAISCLEAIQYMLDLCETTTEAIHAFNDFRIHKNSWMLHYYICDKTGQKAVIEFLNGEMVIYREHEMTEPVITNTSYQVNIDENDVKSLDVSDPYQKNSVERNRIIVQSLKKHEKRTREDYFTILNRVRRSDTLWQCVYDITRNVISLQSRYDSSIHSIACDSFDFSETSQSLLWDVACLHSNTTFEPYSQEKNKKNIEGFFTHESIISMMNLPHPEFMVSVFDTHINEIEMKNSQS